MARNSFYSGDAGAEVTIDNSVAAAALSETNAATSETNAATSATATTADAVATAADLVLTNQDTIDTAADVVLAEADKVQTGLDRVAVAADLVATNQDTIDTAADVVLAEADKVQTGLDRVATAADKVATNADVVLTAADVVSAEADKVQTGLDRVATAADVVLTAADVVSAEADRVATAADRAAIVTIYDNFDDRYLGTKTADPTLDNDGNALVVGAMYFNSTVDNTKFYNGSAWENPEATATSGAATATTKASEASTSAATATTQAGLATTQASTATTQAGISTAKAVLTAADVVLTNADVVLAEADKVQTGLDRIATAADKVATNADVVLTAADVVLAEADRVSSAASAATATTQASTATTQAGIATAKAVLTAADVVSTAADVVSSAASAASAAATYDGFDDRYLGSKSSAPTVDNDGNALVVGALYYDSTDTTMMVRTASGWIATSSATLATMNRFVFTATANQTVFTGADDGSDTLAIVVGAELITLNGITLEITTDYTVTTTTLTLTSGAAVGDEVNIYAFGNFELSDHYNKTVADARFLGLAGGAMTGAITTNSTFDGVDIATRDGILTSTTTTAGAALPKAGGAMTGAITTNSTFDGRDVAADGVTADAALPKAGGAMTGAITTNSTFDGVDIATRDAVLTSTTTTASAALPKAGGAMTGAITTNSTFDGIDIATRDAILTSTTTTAGAALPKAGGAMTGAITTNSTFDTRDVATDGTKLDTIETSATADQTNAEIKTAIEAGTNIALGGSPTTTTQAESDDSTKIATTAYVVDKITTLIGGAPSTLNDLNELAAAINDDANYNSTLTTALATKLPLAGGTMTGDLEMGNNEIYLIDNGKLRIGSGQDLEIYHDGIHSYIQDRGTGDLRIKGNNIALRSNDDGDNYIYCAEEGAVTLYYHDAGKLATTSTGISVTGNIANTSGDLTLDVAGDIILDADGADIKFYHAGSHWGSLYTNATPQHLYLQNMVSDGDIIFAGNDGGSSINALTLDMSNAGKAVFNAGASFAGGITSTSDITIGSAYISNNYSSFPGLRVPNNDYIGCAAATGMIQFQGSGVTHIPGATTMGGDLTVDTNTLFVDASANKVGIGTTSPLNALQIGSTFPITMNSNYPDIHFNSYYSSPYYRTVTTGYGGRLSFNGATGLISFQVGPSSTTAGNNYSPATALAIDKSGKVGIGGVASPAHNLDISPTSGDAELKISGAEGQSASIRLFADQGDDAADIKRLLTDTSGNFKIQHYASSAYVDSMVIDSSGNVGIGTTNIGTSSHNFGGQHNLTLGGATADSFSVLEIAGNDADDGAYIGAIEFVNKNNSDAGSGTAEGIAAITTVVETGDSNAQDDSGGHLQFWTKAAEGNLSEAMRIDSSGNVGIGDSDPSDAKLSIDNVLAGDVALQVIQAQDNIGIYLDQNGDNRALYIDSESTNEYAIQAYSKWGIYSNQDISGGTAAFFIRNLAEAGSYPLVEIRDDHPSNTQPALKIQQDGAGYGINIDHNGNYTALYINSASTSTGGIIEVEGNSLTSGRVMNIVSNSLTTGNLANFYSNAANTSTRNLVAIHNDSTVATETTALKVQQDSTGLIADFNGPGGVSQNGMKTVTFSFGMGLNVATNFDIPITNTVNYFEIKAIMGYYPGVDYTTDIHGLYAYRSDSGILRVQNFSDTSTSNSGSWTVSNPDTTTIRVTKNAGAASAFARGFVEVKYRDA